MIFVGLGEGEVRHLSGGAGMLGVNYWRLNFPLRAKLGGQILGEVWPLIWWISGGFRPPGAVATDIRADPTLIRF